MTPTTEEKEKSFIDWSEPIVVQGSASFNGKQYAGKYKGFHVASITSNSFVTGEFYIHVLPIFRQLSFGLAGEQGLKVMNSNLEATKKLVETNLQSIFLFIRNVVTDTELHKMIESSKA